VGWGEDTVKSSEVKTGGRHERAESADELVRGEDEVSGAVPPGLPEADDHAVVSPGPELETLGSHRAAGSITAQSFEATTVPGGNAHASVYAEPVMGPAGVDQGRDVGADVDAVAGEVAVVVVVVVVARGAMIIESGRRVCAEAREKQAGSGAESLGPTNGGGICRSQERVLLRESVDLGRVAVVVVALLLEEPGGAHPDVVADDDEVGPVGRRQGMEGRRSTEFGVVDPDAIGDEGVPVGIEPQAVAEALRKRDRAAVNAGLWSETQLARGGAAEKGKDLVEEDAEDEGEDLAVIGEQVAEGRRKGDDPHADGEGRKDGVGEEGRGVVHASGRAGRTEAAALAGPGDQPLLVARAAPDPGGAMLGHAATQEALELVADEARHGSVFGVALGEKGREVSVEDPVENRVAGISGAVAGG
jgi:hypothetical protein